MSPEAVRARRHLAVFARVATALSFLVVVLDLLGWNFGVVMLVSLVPYFVSMKPITAVCFLACSIPLWLHFSSNDGRPAVKSIARLLPIVPVFSGAATIFEFLTGQNLAFEEVFFHRAIFATGIVHPGCMSVATGVSFLVLGLALLLFDPHSKEEKSAWQPLSLAVVVFSLVQFLGYLYGVSDLYRTFHENPMSVQTAAVFLLLGLAMFATRPDRGWMAVFTSPLSGGVMARRILLAAVLLPVLYGSVSLLGQGMGWYQTEFGIALLTSLNIASFVMVTWFGSRS
ncbi:MAG: hypothetical protein WBQ59_20170 [Candidatus Acidiferrum sp.]